MNDNFIAYVRHVMNTWSALSIAVEHADPRSGPGLREDLIDTVIEWFSNGEIYEEELVELFDDFFVNDFGVVVEDGSGLQVAQLIRDMYLHPRPFEAPKTAANSVKHIKAKRTSAEGEEDETSEDDDQEDGDEDEDEEEGEGEVGEEAVNQGESSTSSRSRTVTDEDGWTTVVSRSGKPKKGPSGGSAPMDLDQ
jgi:hypothetical protein